MTTTSRASPGPREADTASWPRKTDTLLLLFANLRTVTTG